MIRTQISMTERQAKRLRELAAARNASQAALLREALDALLDEDERVRRLRRALEPVGRYRSGDPDVALDHDEALTDAFSP